MTTITDILVREIRAQLPNATDVSVSFDHENETITATVDGTDYVCHAGSDDDRFVFANDDCDVILFDFPADYLDLIS